MDEIELFKRISPVAMKITDIAIKNGTPSGLGFAIPIPKEATPEALDAVDAKLVGLCWNFERISIRHKEYYVLFPI